jgi:hypothetical protein
VTLWGTYSELYGISPLTEEAFMVSIPKVVGVLSCGCLLCLGLSNVASSADKLNTGQSETKMLTVSDQDNFQAGREVKGKVIRVVGEKYFVREDSGNVVEMHVDATTEKKSKLMGKVGDNVLAKVDAKGHAISFLTDQPISH